MQIIFFKLTQFFNEQKVIFQHVRDESAGGSLNAHHALMLGAFQLELSQPLGLRHKKRTGFEII